MQTDAKVEMSSGKMVRAQTDRSQAMRVRLLDAATELLKERGLARFRTADVVARAAVSKGALLHHFPTKHQLILAVFGRLYVDTDRKVDIDRKNVHAAPEISLQSVVEELIADSHAFFFSDSFGVSLNITISAAQDPELREAVFRVVRRFRDDAEEMWATRLAAFGVSREQALNSVWLINGAMRGLAMRALWELDKPIFARLERLMASLVISHLSALQNVTPESGGAELAALTQREG